MATTLKPIRFEATLSRPAEPKNAAWTFLVLPKAANVAANAGILVLIVGSYIANRQGNFPLEKGLVGVLILGMMALVFYGVMSLRSNQLRYDSLHPEKVKDKDKDKKAAA